ncbi:MAG: ATP-dependent Clp protease adapter ClpS [Spirochaetota bacterium]|nr:ATP-dependent Clp protease adapter ClpS [Spirochaetota bacterium]
MPEDIRWNDGTSIQEREEQKTREPDMFRVVLLNDDYTTMDFVVWVIQKIFHKAAAEATKIMMDVHKKGRGVVGVYSYDIARTKAVQVKQLAKEHEYPLECVIEKE